MKRDYNKNTTSDMPMDSNFNSTFDSPEHKKEPKQKIKAIGAKANNKTETEDKSTKKLKTKATFTEDFIDLEKMNEEHSQAYRFKKRRNSVIISLLVVMCVIAIAAVSTLTVVTRLQENCYMYVEGAQATYIVNDIEIDNFRAPSGVQGKRILRLKIELRIEEGGEFEIKFIPKCYRNDIRLNNVLFYNLNFDLFQEGENGYAVTREGTTVSGNQTIRLCGGIILDDTYGNLLNIDNFKLEFCTYLEKV